MLHAVLDDNGTGDPMVMELKGWQHSSSGIGNGRTVLMQARKEVVLHTEGTKKAE